MKSLFILVLCLSLLFSCNNSTAPTPEASSSSAVDTGLAKPVSYPEERKEVRKTAVATYKERVNNPLNEWYFSVQLFETPHSFHYKMLLQYEEIRGVDTLKLPNFGLEPKPEIRKGPDAFSCIIGFLDKDGKFREYKKVYVVNGALKVTAIKHYGVSTTKRELE